MFFHKFGKIARDKRGRKALCFFMPKIVKAPRRRNVYSFFFGDSPKCFL